MPVPVKDVHSSKVRIGSPFEKKSELEQACQLVIDASLATGHADTVLDLVAELIFQAKEVRPCPICDKRREQTRLRVAKSRQRKANG